MTEQQVSEHSATPRISIAPPDPPGTCHQVSCPGKGQHAPHAFGRPIGAGAWEDYQSEPVKGCHSQKTEHCLGFPKVIVGPGVAIAFCSIAGNAIWSLTFRSGNIINAAALVDEHKRCCANRKPTP